jgi:hypothetical protein
MLPIVSECLPRKFIIMHSLDIIPREYTSPLVTPQIAISPCKPLGRGGEREGKGIRGNPCKIYILDIVILERIVATERELYNLSQSDPSLKYHTISNQKLLTRFSDCIASFPSAMRMSRHSTASVFRSGIFCRIS